MKKYTFKKSERLKSRKIIERIFNREGQSFATYPILTIWLETPLNTDFPAQVTFSVSKKKFKKAVQRNRIKRLMREAYRLNKPKFYESLQVKEKQVAVIFVYIAKEELAFEVVEAKMKQSLKRLRRNLK
ncbi:MAG: ribonuclease P protein component [Saprospiraceae bacterium]